MENEVLVEIHSSSTGAQTFQAPATKSLKSVFRDYCQSEGIETDNFTLFCKGKEVNLQEALGSHTCNDKLELWIAPKAMMG